MFNNILGNENNKKILENNIKTGNIIVNSVKIKHFRSVSVNKIFKEIDKLVFFYESQFYYHTTYNDVNNFEILFLGITQSISLFFKGVIRFIKKL